MSNRYSFAGSLRLLLAAVSILALLPGCGRQSPVAPGGGPPMISGYVYREMTPGSGEPPIADVLITVRDATGVETTASSDGRGVLQRPCRDRPWW